MFCKNCGATMPSDGKFCENCGAAALGGASQQIYTQAQPVYNQVQPVYTQPQSYNQAVGSGLAQSNRDPLSVGNYIGMFILSVIPVVGIIMLLVWAFGSSANLNKKNYARAILIIGLIGAGIWLIVFIIGLVLGISILPNLY